MVSVRTKLAAKTNEIYSVDGVYVNSSVAKAKANSALEERANSLLFEVESDLASFHTDFKHELVDDSLRLQQKWDLYNSRLN
jgi:hypothetical protein